MLRDSELYSLLNINLINDDHRNQDQLISEQNRKAKIEKFKEGLQTLIDKSDFNLFLTSYQPKRLALRNLQIQLETAVKGLKNGEIDKINIEDIFNKWAKQPVFTKVYEDENRIKQTIPSSNLDVIKGVRNIFKDDHKNNESSQSFTYLSLMDLFKDCKDVPLSANDVFISKKDKHFIFDQVVADVTNPNKRIAMRQWKDKILNTALFNLGFNSSKSHFSTEDTAKLYNEISHIVYFHEGIPLFTNDNPKGITKLQTQCRNLLKFLLTDAPLSNDLFEWKIIKAIMLEKDQDLLSGLRKEIQTIFHHIFSHIHLKNISPEQEQQLALQISDILAMYTFFDPHKDLQKVLRIPKKVDGCWVMVDFEVIPIKLQYDDETATLLENEIERDGMIVKEDIHQNYPVYSYILKPKAYADIENKIDPYLLFMGTPPPSLQGHFYASRTDFAPGCSVGETMYNANRHILSEALDLYVPNKQLNVTGQSLGGAMSLFFALDNPYRCKRVDAFNPPGLYEKSLSGPLSGGEWEWNKEHGLSEKEKKNKVFIHVQEDDPVNKIGYWKNEWNLIKIFKPKSPSSPLMQTLLSPLFAIYYLGCAILSKWLAHIQTFSSVPHSIALLVNTSKDNQKKSREYATNLKQTFSGFFYNNINNKIKDNNRKLAAENHHKLSALTK